MPFSHWPTKNRLISYWLNKKLWGNWKFFRQSRFFKIPGVNAIILGNTKGRVQKKKKIVEFSTKRLTPPPFRGRKILKQKIIYAPWNKFCMIWVLSVKFHNLFVFEPFPYTSKLYGLQSWRPRRMSLANKPHIFQYSAKWHYHSFLLLRFSKI